MMQRIADESFALPDAGSLESGTGLGTSSHKSIRQRLAPTTRSHSRERGVACERPSTASGAPGKRLGLRVAVSAVLIGGVALSAQEVRSLRAEQSQTTTISSGPVTYFAIGPFRSVRALRSCLAAIAISWQNVTYRLTGPVEWDKTPAERFFSPTRSAYSMKEVGVHSGDIPVIVDTLSAGAEPQLVWRNELGGLTFRIGDRYVKWNPAASTINLIRERRHLEWLRGRHVVPRVVDFGTDDEGEWLVTVALAGESAVSDVWKRRPRDAVAAMATGLRKLHAIGIDEFPAAWTLQSWVSRTPMTLGEKPPVDGAVLVHGDACAPNTLISSNGVWAGNVDFVDLGIGDRWADLAVASMSLAWNFGHGFEEYFFDAYGIDPDPVRIAYYRALWHLAS